MKIAHVASGVWEQERLNALDELDVLDTPREEAFEHITRMICTVLGVPIATVSLLDGHRQWHKAVIGLDADYLERKETFCQHTILGAEPMVVENALEDARFAASPLVLGEPNIRFYAGAPLTTKDGHNVGVVCAIDSRPREFTPQQAAILAGFASLAMEELELRRLATLDGLTGAMTRRAFRQAGKKSVTQALRRGQALSAVMLDLDHFKRVNDTFGHATGDKVLVATAAACHGLLRHGDHFGRLGGEEFAILLPGSDRASALDVAERLRVKLEGLEFDDGLKVSASFGVAALDGATRDIDLLLSRADAALYDAKGSGRNRCVVWRSADGADRGPRKRVMQAGRIRLADDAAASIDCTVTSLGAKGAGLQVVGASGLPDQFVLIVAADGSERRCRAVSRTDRHVEVEFCPAAGKLVHLNAGPAAGASEIAPAA